MNRLVGLYILIILFIAGFVLYILSPYATLVPSVSFSPLLHKMLEGSVALILFLIFLRANHLYSKTNDKRMAVIAGGFLVASLLDVYHVFIAYGFPYDILTVQNFQKQPKSYYLLIEKLIISISLFISVFFTSKPSYDKSKNFRRKTYGIYFGIVLLLIFLYQVIFPLLPGTAIYKMILSAQTLEVIDDSLFLLTAFIYADMRLSSGRNIFSTFIIGLFILELSQLFYVNPNLIQIYGILAHIFKLVGFIFLLIGIKDIQVSNVLNLRQKSLAYQSSFLIFAYIIFESLSSAVFNINFPSYSPDIFLEFLLIAAIIQYLLSVKLTQPIINVINAMDKYKPGEKLEEIPIVSNDEICILTSKFNQITDLNWEYTQELKETEKQISQQRDKERILREIISELKLSQNLDQAYNHLLTKLSSIFNVDRVIFIELPLYNTRKITTKYEYLKNPDEASLLGIEYPEAASEDFFELLRNLDLSRMLVVDDIKDHHKYDEIAQDFYRKYHIRSKMGNLLVRYNKSAKILGLIVLCSSTLREWTEYEIDLLKAISENIVNVFWEITRILEIDELRNTFILTLAHDFQVPLVGERKALEYIISRDPGEPIGKFREFIEETITNNRNITRMLHKLLDIYNYESGKKTINLCKSSMPSLIDELSSKLKDFAQLKSVSVVLDIEKDLPAIYMDKDEIYKVLDCLIENAIYHTREGTQVTIKCYKENDTVKTCIIDNGTGIPIEARDKIFQRYPMVQAITRKIGAGLGLYLSKLVVEAHHGKIWYETELDKGTTFCFTLPI